MNRAFLTIIALIAIGGAALAQQFQKGDLVVADPWTRATPQGATAGVGYLKITNKGKEADRLTGGTFDGADTVEIHEMKMEGDNMTMRQLSDGLEIKPGETVGFSPGAYHLMFVGLKKAIAQGASVKGTLTFEKAGSIDVDYKVQSVGAMDNSESMHDHMQ